MRPPRLTALTTSSVRAGAKRRRHEATQRGAPNGVAGSVSSPRDSRSSADRSSRSVWHGGRESEEVRMENEGARVASSPGRRFCSTGIDGQPSNRDGRPSSLESQFGASFPQHRPTRRPGSWWRACAQAGREAQNCCWATFIMNSKVFVSSVQK
jgi:hypothetical protein